MSSPYLPLLKPDHEVPFELMRKCPTCHQNSIFVNFMADFYLRCLNPGCPAQHGVEYLPCMLKHREHQTTTMTLKSEGAIAVDREGQPDFDHPIFEPTLTEGPYKDCPGFLCWDKEQAAKRDAWLVCNVCRAVYHTIVFATYGIVTSLHHSQFRLKVDSQGRGAYVSEWGPLDRVYPVSPNVALCVLEVRWNGQEIRETEEFFR